MCRVCVDCTFLNDHAEVFYKPMSLYNLMDDNIADWGEVTLLMDLKFENFTFIYGFNVFIGDQMSDYDNYTWIVNVNGIPRTMTEVMLDVDLELKHTDLIVIHAEK